VKQAAAKPRLAADVLTKHYQADAKWLVYCDSLSQLREVMAHLDAAGLPRVVEYHSAMVGSRDATLQYFEHFGGIVVSIRCLDEGVDIPTATHALILASSRNPREFVQRRGRVLRTAPGKPYAILHDALVLPPDEPSDRGVPSFLRGELARAIEFGSSAINPAAVADIAGIAAHYGIDVQAAAEEGFESD
jgi:superfamily II DNA or RNA helicase